MDELSRIHMQIRSLEAQKQTRPGDEDFSRQIDGQVTLLCDRIKVLQRAAFKPRGVA